MTMDTKHIKPLPSYRLELLIDVHVFFSPSKMVYRNQYIFFLMKPRF